MLQTTLLILNAVLAVSLVLLILLQRQDTSGGGIMGGANLGGGPAVRNPLAKPTGWIAAIFMVNCLILAMTSSGQGKAESVFDRLVNPTEVAQKNDEIVKTQEAAEAMAEQAPTDALVPEALPAEALPTEDMPK